MKHTHLAYDVKSSEVVTIWKR